MTETTVVTKDKTKKVKLKKAEKEFRDNARAFEAVIGNPFAYPESVQGHYTLLKTRSVQAVDISSVAGTINEARPSTVDFAIDVDHAIEEGIRVYNKQDKSLFNSSLLKFIGTYLTEESVLFTQDERRKLEQIIGRLLRVRGIFPIVKYFTAVRQKVAR